MRARCALARWACGVLVLTGLLAGCAGGRPSASSGPGATAGHTASAPQGPSSGDRYPLGVTVFPAGQRRPLPALTGKTLSGPALALSSLRGRTVVLTVWASWCEPCRTELPDLATLAAQVRPAGVRFVGLDEDTDLRAATSALHSTGSTYPHLADHGALLARLSAWLPTAVPGTVVVDPQGRVAARVVGPVTAAQLRPLLAGLAPV